MFYILKKMTNKDQKQKLNSVEFIQLKGLKNLKLSFMGERVTAIFGVNGSGKSTILHALACLYRPVSPMGEKNYFPRFFKRENKVTWSGSRLIADFTFNGTRREIKYEKKGDRWTPRIDRRPSRDVVYVGINSCVPDIENAVATNSIFNLEGEEHVQRKDKIIESASNIMNYAYEDYSKARFRNKKYKKVRRNGVINYSSLSMGAGEQRLFSLLEILHSMPRNSLLLIDELDLTLHTLALRKLIKEMVKVANKMNLQIVFTTHREELISEKGINIRHIWNAGDGGQTFVLDHTTPECFFRLTGKMEKKIEIYVEDELAESIARAVASQNDLLSYVSFHKFGSAGNVFVVAAGLDIQEENFENKVFVLDGDVFRTRESRLKQLKKIYSGTEIGKEQKRSNILENIKQFSLPENEQPEHYLWTKLKSTNHKFSTYAKEIHSLPDSHGYLDEILYRSGEQRNSFYMRLTDIFSEMDFWSKYVQELDDWLKRRKESLGL